MTSLLAPCMVRHPTVKPALETFLMTHILHEFNAPEGYMRYIVNARSNTLLLADKSLTTSRARLVKFWPVLPNSI